MRAFRLLRLALLFNALPLGAPLQGSSIGLNVAGGTSWLGFCPYQGLRSDPFSTQQVFDQAKLQPFRLVCNKGYFLQGTNQAQVVGTATATYPSVECFTSFFDATHASSYDPANTAGGGALAMMCTTSPAPPVVMDSNYTGPDTPPTTCGGAGTVSCYCNVRLTFVYVSTPAQQCSSW
jgi:hypothetical protein